MSTGHPTADLPWPLPLKPQVEGALDRLLPPLDAQPEPLHRALRYAVFAEGKRLRPQLLLHVAAACGASAADADLAMRAACAVELVHIACLTHDDMPCFDNAELRRGRPTVHVLFGEARALLVGDALLSFSFELLMGATRTQAVRALRIGQLLARAASASCGLLASASPDSDAPLCATPAESAAKYHAQKRGALFAMAAESGAIAAGSRRSEDWASIGRLISRGYQLVHSLPYSPSVGDSATADSRAHLLAVSSPSHAALRAQLSTVAARLNAQIRALAPRPEPLIDFLSALYLPLLQSSDGSTGPQIDPTADRADSAVLLSPSSRSAE